MSLADIYSKGVITQRCILSITEVGKNVKEILSEKKILEIFSDESSQKNSLSYHQKLWVL